jgi:hypothetical protein
MQEPLAQIKDVLKNSQHRSFTAEESATLRREFGKLFFAGYSPETGKRFCEAFERAEALVQEVES